jgi:hypothetical protein
MKLGINVPTAAYVLRSGVSRMADVQGVVVDLTITTIFQYMLKVYCLHTREQAVRLNMIQMNYVKTGITGVELAKFYLNLQVNAQTEDGKIYLGMD